MRDIFNVGRVLRAARYSWQGLATVTKKESAFRQELALAVVMLPAGLWLGQGGVEKALLVSSVLLVLIVELLNTGIETTINRISTDPHPLSGLAKDIGSAAVCLALGNAFVIWVLLLWPRL